jgi:hypothetical protein
MILTAQFVASLIEPPSAFAAVLLAVNVVTGLALGAIVYLLALFGPGMRL